MPVIQMGMALYNMQASDPESVPGKMQAAWKDPEACKLIDLGLDMFSHEVFCYGDQSTVQAVELLQRVVGAMRYGPMVMEVTGKAKGIDSNQQQAAILLRALAENPDQLQVPNMVMGFKLDKKDLAAESLEKLQQAANAAVASEPTLQGRLKKTEIAGHEYLTLSLDGQMIPYQIPAEEIEKLKQLEAKPGDVDKLIAQVKKMTLVVAVGVREDYLLVSVGATTDALARLGAGKPIADRPELKPLEKYADKRIASIGYFSKALADSLTNQRRNINDLMAAGDEVLAAAELTDEQKSQIRKDTLGPGRRDQTASARARADHGILLPDRPGLRRLSIRLGHAPATRRLETTGHSRTFGRQSAVRRGRPRQVFAGGLRSGRQVAEGGLRLFPAIRPAADVRRKIATSSSSFRAGRAVAGADRQGQPRGGDSRLRR